MRVVIAADKFKGSVSAQTACHAIAEGVRRANPGGEVVLLPIADGGEGTAEVLAAADGGKAGVADHDVVGPLPDMRVHARVFLLGDGKTAAFDMASAAGFSLLADDQRDPTKTTSFGVGELIRRAIDAGRTRILVGLGGSATCDGGLGAAQALGAEIKLDGAPAPAPFVGGDLSRLTAVRFHPARFAGVEVCCLYDVDNPLLGPSGTAPVFAPQKGASARQVRQLEEGLRRLADLAGAKKAARASATGAAGGLGFGLQLAVGAALRAGAPAIAEAIGLDARLAEADLCFTGEGRFDATSLGGKATITVARRCLAASVPCVVLAGTVSPGLGAAHEHGVTMARSIVPGPMPLADVLPRTQELLADAAEQTMRVFLAGVEWGTP